MYKSDDKKGWEQSRQFKKTFSIDVDIEFVGVWCVLYYTSIVVKVPADHLIQIFRDTVGSVGIIPKRLPFTKSNSHIRHFRHAVSLDERRAKFKVNLWNRTTDDEHALGVKKGDMPRGHAMPEKKKRVSDVKSQDSVQLTQSQFEDQYDDDDDDDEPTDIDEVWFGGAHTGTCILFEILIHQRQLRARLDVGGGSVANGTRHCLARIPLRWMIRQCFELRLGIMFHKNMFKSIGLDPDTLYPYVKPRPPPIRYTPGCLAHQFDPPINSAKDYKQTVKFEAPFESEEMEDMLDSLTPIYDQLRMSRGWWILEIIPNIHHHQKDDNSWSKVTG